LRSVTSDGTASDQERYWPKEPVYWPVSSYISISDDFGSDPETLLSIRVDPVRADGGVR
jgi:hypothetical protein